MARKKAGSSAHGGRKSPKTKRPATQPAKHAPRKKKAGPSRAPRGRRREETPCLAALEPDEAQMVLTRLLEAQPALRTEAEALARSLLDDDPLFEAVAEEVVSDLESLDPHDLGHRAGRQPWGYVEPNEAAGDMLDEAFEPFRKHLQRLQRLGLEGAARSTLQGLLVGLYRLDTTLDDSTDIVLEYVEDWPLETACHLLDTWTEAPHPGKRRVTSPVDEAFVREHLSKWAKYLLR